MELRELRSFCAAARLKSISKAAEELGIGQPTVTTRIKKLEQELGMVLFDRVKRPSNSHCRGQTLRGLLGEDAPVSASTVARLKSKWNDELAQWRNRPLDDLEVVYMWVDGVYVKAGLEKEKAAVLVVMAALSDGSKVVVSTVPGYRESTESWSEVLTS